MESLLALVVLSVLVSPLLMRQLSIKQITSIRKSLPKMAYVGVLLMPRLLGYTHLQRWGLKRLVTHRQRLLEILPISLSSATLDRTWVALLMLNRLLPKELQIKLRLTRERTWNLKASS